MTTLLICWIITTFGPFKCRDQTKFLWNLPVQRDALLTKVGKEFIFEASKCLDGSDKGKGDRFFSTSVSAMQEGLDFSCSVRGSGKT